MDTLDILRATGGLVSPEGPVGPRTWATVLSVGASARAMRVARRLSTWESAEHRALFFSPRWWSVHQAWEGTIAHGLEGRGAATKFVRCGRAMPLCDAHLLQDLPRAAADCRGCAAVGRVFLAAMGHDSCSMDEFSGRGAGEADARIAALPDLDAVFAHRDGDAPIGEWIQASLLRFFRVGHLAGTGEELEVARAFLRGAAAVRRGADRLLDAWRPTHAVLLNGKFYPERTFWERARARGVEVVTYERGFLVDTLIFARGGAVNDLDVSAHLGAAFERGLGPAEEARLDAYLADRRVGARSVVQYWPELETGTGRIRAALDLSEGGDVTVAFPNILWDTAVLQKDVHFAGLFDWLETTVRWYARHPERILVVRCHPAEVRLAGQETRDTVGARLARTFPDLPRNVRVVAADSPISSYALAGFADRVLVYTSTLGLEMALAARQVVVSGQTHYAGHGFTMEPRSREHYAELLSSPPAPPSDEAVSRARRYAHLFFFRFMLPMDLVREPRRGAIELGYRSVTDLAPGRNRTLDTICDGILDGGPFLARE